MTNARLARVQSRRAARERDAHNRRSGYAPARPPALLPAVPHFDEAPAGGGGAIASYNDALLGKAGEFDLHLSGGWSEPRGNDRVTAPGILAGLTPREALIHEIAARACANYCRGGFASNRTPADESAFIVDGIGITNSAARGDQLQRSARVVSDADRDEWTQAARVAIVANPACTRALDALDEWRELGDAALTLLQRDSRAIRAEYPESVWRRIRACGSPETEARALCFTRARGAVADANRNPARGAREERYEDLSTLDEVCAAAAESAACEVESYTAIMAHCQLRAVADLPAYRVDFGGAASSRARRVIARALVAMRAVRGKPSRAYPLGRRVNATHARNMVAFLAGQVPANNPRAVRAMRVMAEFASM